MALELFVRAIQKQSTTNLMYHFTAGFISMLCCHETECIKVNDSSISFMKKKVTFPHKGKVKPHESFLLSTKTVLIVLTLRGYGARGKQTALKAFSGVASSTSKLHPCSASCFTKQAWFSDSYETGDDSINASCSLNKLCVIAAPVSLQHLCNWLS